MKIQAKNVEVGHTIKWGVLTLKVNSIELFSSKNGREGRVFVGPATRSMGKGFNKVSILNTDISVWSETWVSLV